MLRRESENPQKSFADQSLAALAVPADHLLLQMKQAVNWTEIETTLAPYYDRWEGRPGYPPAQLLRMLILEQYADLSDRDVAEQTGYNLLYRTFVGVGLEETVPDDTTLVRFRARLGEQGLREVFEAVLSQWQAAGLIGTERRAIDGCHLWAKVARRSWISLLREGRALVVEALAEADGELAEALRQTYLPEPGSVEPRGEEALAAERAQTREFLCEVAERKEERVVERVRLLEAMLGDGDRPVSFLDPDARWGHKSKDKSFCGYKTHEALDPDTRMITSVEVVAGNADEALRTEVLLNAEQDRLEPGFVVIGDGLYNKAATVAQVESAGGQACFSGLKAKRVSDAFSYEADSDRMVCQAGKASIGKVRVDQGDLYYFSVIDCRGCAFSAQCLTSGEREGSAMARRRVYLSDVRKRKVLAGEAGRQWRREQHRVRYRIEAKFDEQMNRHGLRRARYWGLGKVSAQVLLNVITVNLKRAARLLAHRSGPPQMVVQGI
jgi:IS5 family transposase